MFLCNTELAIKYVKLRQQQEIEKPYHNLKKTFSLIVEQILAFASITYLVREVKDLSPNCIIMFYVKDNSY